jgi:RNA polymerase sigma-70 factor (ECF subfamily)
MAATIAINVSEVIHAKTIAADSPDMARATGSDTAPAKKGIDIDLFERFFAGDDGAFMEIFDRHTHRLYLYCLKYVGERQAAEDLVQDVWERIMKLRSSGAEPPNVPLALLYRIARNLSLNYIRNRRNHTQLDALPEYKLPSVTPREKTRHEELVTIALEHLPINYREVLILNAYSDYRFDEIAEMLDEPVGAVRTRAWRARNRLARLLAALIGLDDPDERIDGGTSGDDADDPQEELE